MLYYINIIKIIKLAELLSVVAGLKLIGIGSIYYYIVYIYITDILAGRRRAA